MKSIKKQRGFIYLTTGANGSGKTLNTLKWVRDRQLKENRPVYHNGRFEMTADFGWKQIDFKDWQSLPDGAIILVDECHNDLPLRAGSAPPPEHVRMLAEHRRRGFDFYLITQHPQNIDLFVRRLIGSPGWHRHLKRTFGADLVSVLEWSAVKDGCERTASGKDAKVSMVPFPKEVYDWYKSASLHTGKKSIPKAVYVLILAIILIPFLFYYAFTSVARSKPDATAQATASVVPGRDLSSPGEKRPMTAVEYAAAHVPRVAGFPQSAPRYDELNKVAQVPKPAACIDGVRPGSKVRSCACWTQQATRVDMPDAVCKQLAAGGFFDDSLPPPGDRVAGRTALPPLPPPVAALPVPASAQAPVLPPGAAMVAAAGTRDASYGYGLRNSRFLDQRNASVDSVVRPDNASSQYAAQ